MTRAEGPYLAPVSVRRRPPIQDLQPETARCGVRQRLGPSLPFVRLSAVLALTPHPVPILEQVEGTRLCWKPRGHLHLGVTRHLDQVSLTASNVPLGTRTEMSPS